MSWQLENKLKKLLKNEAGTVIKDPGGKRTIVLIYPNTYHVGMSNLGLHNVYRLLNEREDTLCERAFLPERADIAEHKRTNTPIMSVESQRPVADFDIIAFSMAFENDVKNIQTILELSKIDANEVRRPKLICGGAAVTLNPELFGKIFDEVIEGDFEKGDSPLSAGGLSPFPAHTAIWTPNTEFGSMHLVEMQRGCPHKCKFCAAPVIYCPFKQFSKEEIINAINFGLPHRKKIGLIGGDVLAHPNFVEITEYIHSCGGTFSPSSVRADRITDKIAELLAKSGHKTVTLAPEAGSETLRKKAGKNIPDEKFFRAAQILSAHGIRQLKLYFMIGLPGETEEDVRAIEKFAAKMGTKTGTVPFLQGDCPRFQKITVAVNPFVPKSRTPFSNELFAGVNELKKKISLLKKLLSGIQGVTLKFESPLSALHEYEMQS